VSLLWPLIFKRKVFGGLYEKRRCIAWFLKMEYNNCNKRKPLFFNNKKYDK